MRVEDPEAPRGDHEQSDAGEHHLHELHRELALVTRESRREEIDQVRRGEHAGRHQYGRDEREQREHRAGDAAGLFFVALGEQARIHRNEGRREHALTKQVLQEIRNSNRRAERVRRFRRAKESREVVRADEPHDTAQENSGGDEDRPAGRLATALRGGHRSVDRAFHKLLTCFRSVRRRESRHRP